jgi:tetratricopeptide (TPR) repeat protein
MDKGLRQKLASAISPVLLFAFVFALYLPSIRNDFIYDDHQLILEQPMPKSFADIFKVFGERHWYNLPYYRPLARFTMVAQKYLHGERAVYFHLFNSFLIAVTALMAFELLRLPVFGIKPLAAFFAAAVFAVHPIASSCVYPICSGRETLIPAFFIIASVYVFLHSGTFWYISAILLFAASLFSKEQAVVVPVFFVLADLLGISSNPPGRNVSRWIKRYVPVLGILIAYIVIRYFLFGGKGEHHFAIFSCPYGPLLSLLYMIQTMFVPFFELVYEPQPNVWLSVWRIVISLAAVCAVILTLEPRWSFVRKAVLFWLCWIVLSIAPTANILSQEAGFAERYGLLALLGLIAIIATIISSYREKPALRKAIAAAAVFILLGCAAISFNRCKYFRDDLSFLNQWLKTDPYNPQAHASIGLVLFNQKKFDQAISHYRNALKFGPDNANTRSNLAIALISQGRIDEAIVQFERVVQLEPKRAGGYKDLANAFQLKGDIEQAVRYFEKYVELNPNDAQIHNKMAILLAAEKNTKDAIKHFRKAIELKPDWPEPLNSLAWVLATYPDISETERTEAVGLAERVVELTGGRDPSASDTLAAAYAATGRFEKAVETAKAAIELAGVTGERKIAEEIRQRLELYKNHKPYQEPNRK